MGEGLTAALRAHDGDDGVGEAAIGEPRGPDEPIQALHVEGAVAVDQLRRATLVAHLRFLPTRRRGW